MTTPNEALSLIHIYKIYYGAGIPKYDDPTWIKETTWGSQGIRKALREHATENGTRPVERLALAVKELNMDRQKNPKQYPDSCLLYTSGL